MGLKEQIALASLDQQAHRDVQTRKEAQLISVKMQLDVVGRQIERADKKGDNAKVEELKMKEEKLSTMMATIMDPIPRNEYMSAMINHHIVLSGRHTQLRPRCADIRDTVAAPFHPNMCRICQIHTAIESSDSHFMRVCVRCCFSICRVDNIGIEEDSATPFNKNMEKYSMLLLMDCG